MQNEIHIRSHATGLYLKADGEWSEIRRARHFLTAADAKEWCAQHQLTNVEIVVVRDALICMRVAVV